MADILQLTYKGFVCDLRSDELIAAVYDPEGRPCGSIERPGRYNKTWNAYIASGDLRKKGAVGPRGALMWVVIGAMEQAGKM